MKPSKKGRIIAFIAEFTDQHGFSPTYREIAEGLGYASVSTVHKHITELKEKGLISETDGKSRNEVTEAFPVSFKDGMRQPSFDVVSL